MKIIYVSNFMNHHQLPFSMALLNQKDIEYTFISLESIPEERLNMGYEDMNHKYSFVLCAYDSAKNMKIAEKLIDEADVAIYGSCPDKMILRRMKRGKLSFKFSERYFKEGTGISRLPHNWASAWKHLKPFEKGPLYFCCSSAYTAADLNRYTNFRNRAFKWGYFPETKKYNIETLMSRKSSCKIGNNQPAVSILWVGRLIKWKHPEAAIELAVALKKKGYSFKITIIGNGELEEQLRIMIEEKKVSDYVELIGAIASSKVRTYMEKTDVFLFTSDFNEGWGAVLNEAMNSACAVVASHAIGAVPFLVRDGENGFIYENGNRKQFEEKVCLLLDNPELRKRMGRKAYKTIVDLWNSEIAANRFVELVRELKNGNSGDNMFEDGPCSKAEILDNGWYHIDEN